MVLAIQTPIMIALNNGTFAKGNAEEYSVSNTPIVKNSPLEGKNMIF